MFCFYPSLLFWAGWINGGMFHVAVFRRLLFLSIWSRSLAQQPGQSIRCFEVARSILSLYFLFRLPVAPQAFVALIREGPILRLNICLQRVSVSSLEKPKDGWCFEEGEVSGQRLEWWKTWGPSGGPGSLLARDSWGRDSTICWFQPCVLRNHLKCSSSDHSEITWKLKRCCQVRRYQSISVVPLGRCSNSVWWWFWF